MRNTVPAHTVTKLLIKWLYLLICSEAKGSFMPPGTVMSEYATALKYNHIQLYQHMQYLLARVSKRSCASIKGKKNNAAIGVF